MDRRMYLWNRLDPGMARDLWKVSPPVWVELPGLLAGIKQREKENQEKSRRETYRWQTWEPAVKAWKQTQSVHHRLPKSLGSWLLLPHEWEELAIDERFEEMSAAENTWWKAWEATSTDAPPLDVWASLIAADFDGAKKLTLGAPPLSSLGAWGEI